MASIPFFECKHSIIRLDAITGIEKINTMSGQLGTINIYVFGDGKFVLAGADAIRFLEDWESYLLGDEE